MNKTPCHGFHSVMQSMVGRILFTVITAASGMITAHCLHASGRGELAALTIWPVFIGNLMTLGLPSSLTYWSRKTPSESSQILSAAAPITVLLGCLAVIGGVIAIPFFLYTYSQEVVHAAQWCMLGGIPVLITAVAGSRAEADGDFLRTSIALCLTPLLTDVALVAVHFAVGLTPVKAAICYGLAGLPSCVYLTSRLIPELHFPSRDTFAYAKRLLQYGIRSYGIDICGTLAVYADQAIVVRFISPEAMGTYVVALSLSRTLSFIHTAVAAVVFPKAVSLSSEETFNMTCRAARISCLCSALGATALAICGPFLLSLLYGYEYRNASLILNILLAECVLTGTMLVITRAVMAIGRPGLVTLLQSSGLVLSLPLLFVLVPRWQIVGASIALLFASLGRLLITAAVFPVVLHQPFPNLLPGIADLRLVMSRVRFLAESFAATADPTIPSL